MPSSRRPSAQTIAVVLALAEQPAKAARAAGEAGRRPRLEGT